ncbi:MAG: hypothetical protein F9K23_16640 [Bacteroidetes bacterium]|nr:MAG: hypothetical protein F9K23_16640 [Bacteroidota bacterium]
MIKWLLCLFSWVTSLCASAQIDIDFLQQNDIPIILANGQVNWDYKNEQASTAVAKAGLKTISIKETGTFPRIGLYGFEQHTPDSVLFSEFEKNGQPKRVFPKDAVVNYNRRGLPVSYTYVETIQQGCATGGFVFSSYHRYVNLYYKKSKLIKTVSGFITNGKSSDGSTTLYNEISRKNAVFNEKVSYLTSDTLTNTSCTFYGPKNRIKGEFKLRNNIGAEHYTLINNIQDSLLYYLMTNPWGAWYDSTFIANTGYLSDSLEQNDRSDEFYDYETAIENLNDSILEIYNELAESYTGYMYDKNGLLTVSGVFDGDDVQQIDKYAYNNTRQVTQWDSWHFKYDYSYTKSPYGLDNISGNYKLSRYFQYDTKGRVQKCFLYVFTFWGDDYEETFSYNSTPYCLEYAFEYDTKNRVSLITITDLQKKAGLTSYPFIVEYTRY